MTKRCMRARVRSFGRWSFRPKWRSPRAIGETCVVRGLSRLRGLNGFEQRIFDISLDRQLILGLAQGRIGRGKLFLQLVALGGQLLG